MPTAAKTQFDSKLFLAKKRLRIAATEDLVGVSNIDQQVHSFEEHAVSITAHHGIYR